MKPSVALILYPGCILFELALALEFLSKKFDIISFSPDGNPVSSSLGLTISTKPFTEGLPENCHAILIPGGDFQSIFTDTNLDLLIQTAFKRQIVLAAVCGGVFSLAKAGILKKKHFVHPFDAGQWEYLSAFFADTVPEDKDFLHDGNILTAQPHAHIDFAVEMAFKLKAITEEKIIFYKNYHRGFPKGRIRPLALGIIQRENGQFLVHEGVDIVKNGKFYRPLGGGIEFGERGEECLIREIQEEIGREIVVDRHLGCVENFFEFQGRTGHEFLQIYSARFTDKSAYGIERFEIDESGTSSGSAVWKSLEEARMENIPFYPIELERLLQSCKENP